MIFNSVIEIPIELLRQHLDLSIDLQQTIFRLAVVRLVTIHYDEFEILQFMSDKDLFKIAKHGEFATYSEKQMINLSTVSFLITGSLRIVERDGTITTARQAAEAGGEITGFKILNCENSYQVTSAFCYIFKIPNDVNELILDQHRYDIEA